MSVYIDMEMPKRCGECPCFHAENPMYCQAVKADKNKKIIAPYGKPRPEWCPLISVPAHGRLVDEKDICDKIRPLIENPYCYNRLQVISETLGNCLQIVRDAPTIIPADELV